MRQAEAGRMDGWGVKRVIAQGRQFAARGVLGCGPGEWMVGREGQGRGGPGKLANGEFPRRFRPERQTRLKKT